MGPHENITRLLQCLDPGAPESFDALYREIYDELRKKARGLMRRERPDHTLNATALVHEGFVKLRRTLGEKEWQNRDHFYGIAVLAMKQILKDYALARKRVKRGGGAARVSLDDPLGQPITFREATALIPTYEQADALLEYQDALERYGKLDPRGQQIFDMVNLLGLEHKEVAQALGISTKTVQRELRAVEAWLKAEYLQA